MIKETIGLSNKQRSIMEYIGSFWQKQGYPPSVRDIVTGCRLSSTSVADYNLKILEKKGLINRHRGVSRGIESPAESRSSVPVIGTIAAGAPIPVPDDESWDMTAGAERLQVPLELLKGNSDVYALRVKGNSMIDALINDGDIVLMQQTNAVDNGEMAAVWLKSEKEATLKKFYAEQGRIRLQPANSTMRPIFTQPGNVEVQGRVMGVIRGLS
jgi:repressor LexA